MERGYKCDVYTRYEPPDGEISLQIHLPEVKRVCSFPAYDNSLQLRHRSFISLTIEKQWNLDTSTYDVYSVRTTSR